MKYFLYSNSFYASMEMPAECTKCKTMFDLDNDMKDMSPSKNFHEFIAEKFGPGTFLCSNCR